MKIQIYLKQSPIFAINSAYEMLIPKINKQLKSEKINLLQGLVLTALFFEGNNENITPSLLAKIFNTSAGNMSHIISALEYQGYVKRNLSKTDARRFNIELKAEGRKKALYLIKFFDRIQGDFEKSLGVNSCQTLAESIHQFGSLFRKNSYLMNGKSAKEFTKEPS